MLDAYVCKIIDIFLYVVLLENQRKRENEWKQSQEQTQTNYLKSSLSLLNFLVCPHPCLILQDLWLLCKFRVGRSRNVSISPSVTSSRSQSKLCLCLPVSLLSSPSPLPSLHPSPSSSPLLSLPSSSSPILLSPILSPLPCTCISGSNQSESPQASNWLCVVSMVWCWSAWFLCT